MEIKIPIVTEKELKRVMVIGSNLHCWQGNGDKAIRKLIKNHGFIQLDPLNPAGRYHDVFFSARISDYRRGQFERIAYSENLIFETYFHNLNAMEISHFPFFYNYTGKEHLGRYYTRLLKNLEEIGEISLLDDVLDYVKRHGQTKSSDLANLGKADPKYASWKSSRKSGTALELLWVLGKLVVAGRDDNFRKIYNLTERHIKKELLEKKAYNEKEQQLYRLRLKLRGFPIIAIGKLSSSKQGKLRSTKKIDFPLEIFEEENSEESRYSPSLAKLNDKTCYIIPSNWNHLCQESLDNEIRAIGPLDPVVWDRSLLKRLFGFDYVWEVYKKPQDRIWGYYVYPLLYQGNFIGRIEAKVDTKLNTLNFFNFQSEKRFNFDHRTEEAFIDLLNRWKQMVGADQIQYDGTIPIKL